MEQLVDYPYGCTEQLTSRLVPLLPLRDLAKDYHLTLPPNVDRVVARTVAEIMSRQRGDGGFGMWADSPESSPFVSAYALWGLGIAKQRGVAVSENTIKQATRYLRDVLASLDKNPILLASGPFIVDVLAENNAPDPGRVSQLFELRDKLPLFSQAMLLHAMASSKADASSIDKLVAEVEANVRLDGPVARVATNTGDRYAVLMDSDTRTAALVLRALLAARPAHPLAARRGGQWRNTQETAWSLLALDDYRKVQEKTLPKDGLERGFFVKKTLRTVTPEALEEALKMIPEKSARGFRGFTRGAADIKGKLRGDRTSDDRAERGSVLVSALPTR